MNYNISVDLKKLKGTFVAELQGKSSSKRCLCIPLSEGSLYEGKKGIYLSMTAYEARVKNFGETHYIKERLTKEQYEAMSEEQRKNIPISGQMNPLDHGAESAVEETHTENPSAQNTGGNYEIHAEGDLPF
jgi:hypothetical protein